MNTLEKFLQSADIDWKDGIEILILAILVYQGYLYFRATRAARILTGLVLVLLGLTLLSAALELDVIEWLLKSISVFLAIALVVIFQPELRRGLAQLGSNPLWSAFSAQRRETADDLIEIAEALSKRRFGALIAVERGISLEQFLDTGVELDCKLSTEMMLAIFQPKGALHDGGVIFRLSDERVVGAGCVFPVSQNELLDRSIGLRHRAAMGITDESDSIAIVVSEETGNVSLAIEGELEQNLDSASFRKKLYEFLLPPSEFEEPGDEESDSPGLESEDREPADRSGGLGRN